MEIDILTFERIQNHILGRMSEEERIAFEGELQVNSALKAQYEEQLILVHSVREVCQQRQRYEMLSKSLTEKEDTLSKNDISELSDDEIAQINRELNEVGVPQNTKVLNKVADRIKIILSWIQGWFSPKSYFSFNSSGNSVEISYSIRMIASLAMLSLAAIAIYIPNSLPSATKVYNNAPTISYSVMRTGDDVSQLIEMAVDKYQVGDFKEAEINLDQAKDLIIKSIDDLSDDDSDIILERQMREQLYNVEWYQACVYMKEKRVRKAKSQLNAIAHSESPHASKAKNLLESIY